MALKTWTGATDTSWSTGTNWGGGASAGSASNDIAIFNTAATVTLTAGLANSLSQLKLVNAAGSDILTINGGVSLSVISSATIAASNTLTNAGAGTASVNLGTNLLTTGTLTGGGLIQSAVNTLAVNFNRVVATDAIVLGAAGGTLQMTGTSTTASLVANFGSIQSLAATTEIDLLGTNATNYTFAGAFARKASFES